MINVTFYPVDAVANGSLKYAVIAANYRGRFVFCRHRQRKTWEIPGGHRELGETITETAQRELYEETGASKADIRPLCVYSVSGTEDGQTVKPGYGMLFFADIRELETLPESEIAEICLADTLPAENTYPQIQPALWRKVQEAG